MNRGRESWRIFKWYISKFGVYPFDLLIRLIYFSFLSIWINDKFYYRKNVEVERYLLLKYEKIWKKIEMPIVQNYTPVIWVFWWQGESCMPPICKICFHSLLRHKNGIKVHLITKDNIDDFLDVPDIIKQKVNNNKLSFTNFSDIIRCMLLSKYGGLWVDSTLYFINDIPLSWFRYPFFSIKNKPQGFKFVSRNRWSTFIMGTDGSCSYFHKLANLMIEYTEMEKTYLEYMTLDYFMDILFRENCYKQILMNVPFQNEGLHDLRANLNSVINKEYFMKLKKENICFKLTYKMQLKEITNNMDTFYKYIKDEEGYSI